MGCFLKMCARPPPQVFKSVRVELICVPLLDSYIPWGIMRVRQNLTKKKKNKRQGGAGDTYQAKACPKVTQNPKKSCFVRKTTIKKWFNSFMEFFLNKHHSPKVQFQNGIQYTFSSKSDPQSSLNPVKENNNVDEKEDTVWGWSLLGKGVCIQVKSSVFPHKSRLHSRMESILKNRARDPPRVFQGHLRSK